jgi:hypothetical protein
VIDSVSVITPSFRLRYWRADLLLMWPYIRKRRQCSAMVLCVYISSLFHVRAQVWQPHVVSLVLLCGESPRHIFLLELNE